VPYPEFDRQAETLEEAIWSAIQAVEATHLGAQVLRVEPNSFVSIPDIARCWFCLPQNRNLVGNDKLIANPT
jgi:hypothetical protein